MDEPAVVLIDDHPFVRRGRASRRGRIAASLRQALGRAWSDVRDGDYKGAVAELEAEAIVAICDLDTFTVEAWEGARAELESARAG